MTVEMTNIGKVHKSAGKGLNLFCYIGSVALKQVLGMTYGRLNADIDAIATFDEAVKFLKEANCNVIYPINQGKTLVGKNPLGVIFEISIAWPGSTNEELLKYLDSAEVAPLNVLYALKMSHRYLRNSPHFYKTMADIRLMRKHGAKIPDDLLDWFKRREKETYDYKHPSLAQDKNNFFAGDGVTYIYDHDSLHEAVAWSGVPMYKKYQAEGSEVQCDRKKWNKLRDYDKNIAVAEEAAVLALERSIIPYPGRLSDYQAFRLALMKVCTSITSGWFREWAWEHHDEILAMLENYPYHTFFKYGLANGVVKKCE
jgi:hypothetical protein